jgi:hypothetical protein
MKRILVICISILCFTLNAQDIDELKQSNKTLTDSLLILNTKFNEKAKKLNYKLHVLKSNKLEIQTKLTRQEQLKFDTEKTINNYQITLTNKFFYDTLKSLDIHIVNNDKGFVKINKLRKHLINSNTIKSSDSLLFTNEFIYSFELDQIGRISKIFKLSNNKEIIKSIESTKKYLKKPNDKNKILERFTGINQEYFNLLIKENLIKDSIHLSIIENKSIKKSEDSISSFLAFITSYVDDVNKYFKSIIHRNNKQIDFIEKQRLDLSKNVFKYPTTRIGKVDLCLQPLFEIQLNDGTPIHQARTPQEWDRLLESKTPAFKYKDFDSKNIKDIFYNEFAVLDNKLAPIGYHILNVYDLESLSGKVIWHKAKEKRKCYCENGYVTNNKYTICSNCNYWTEAQKAANHCSVCRNKRGFSTPLGKKVCANCKGKTFYYSDSYNFETKLEFPVFTSLFPTRYYYDLIHSRDYDGTISSYSSDKEMQILICKNQPFKVNPNYRYLKIDGLSYVDHFLKKNRFNNGDVIKKVTDPYFDPIEWELAEYRKEPAYYIPKEDTLLGFIYNSFAFNDTRGLVPQGLKLAKGKYYFTDNVNKKFNSLNNNEKYRFDHNEYYSKSKYGFLLVCLNETIDYTVDVEEKNENILNETYVPFLDIDDEKSFFKSGTTVSGY